MEEALYYFRANVLFRNYQIEGAADRTLIYLTFFAQQCLKELEKHPGKKEGVRERGGFDCVPTMKGAWWWVWKRTPPPMLSPIHV